MSRKNGFRELTANINYFLLNKGGESTGHWRGRGPGSAKEEEEEGCVHGTTVSPDLLTPEPCIHGYMLTSRYTVCKSLWRMCVTYRKSAYQYVWVWVWVWVCVCVCRPTYPPAYWTLASCVRAVPRTDASCTGPPSTSFPAIDALASCRGATSSVQSAGSLWRLCCS